MIKIILQLLLTIYLYHFSAHASVSSDINSEKLSGITELTRFAFGSCNKESKEQFVWDKVISSKAQLFLWGGDNIYGDKGPNKDNLKKKYDIQNSIEGYARMKTLIPIIGTWDDHDFGKNDAGAEFPDKEKNRHLSLDFLDVPQNAPVRRRDGLYQSYEFGGSEKKVKFILLDNRYNQTSTNILGQNQWQWLEEELRNSDANVHFIVGGIAILPTNVLFSDEWADWPEQKKKLLKLLKDHKTPGVVFLTGDKHFSSITRKHGFLEIMSSGMTHARSGFVLETYLKTLFERTFFKENITIVDINWDTNPVQLSVEVKGRVETKKTTFELTNNQFKLIKSVN